MKDLKINKDTLVKIVLGTLLIGCISYVYISYFWIPLSKKIALFEEKNSEMKTDIMKAKAIIEKYPDLQKKLEELKAQKEEMKKKIPGERNMSELFRIVKRIADKNSIVINSINPLSTVNETYYFRTTYNMTVKGSYHNIGNFLGEIASEQRIINIENLTIGGGEESNATFNLISYQYMEGR